MKSAPLFYVLLVLGSGQLNGAPVDDVRTHLEKLAATTTHFSRSMIIGNRENRLFDDRPVPGNPDGTRSKHPLVAEQIELLKQLRAVDGDRAVLETLLKHSDPKVRTLALGAIFQREDGHDLTLIARLAGDPASTFPDLGIQWSGSPVSSATTPQTVSGVARAMLEFWNVPHEVFAQYQGRTYSAAWFAAKMNRATRRTTPIQAEYQPDIQRVLTEMKALPTPDRFWTQLYVLAHEWFEFSADNAVMTDEELLETLGPIDPAAVLRFLQGGKISDDPALRLDRRENGIFRNMSGFILRHADRFLRPADADALLALGRERSNDPEWVIGAALVQPGSAGGLLRDALAAEVREGDNEAPGKLAGALWRIHGMAEKDFLVDWFYEGFRSGRDPLRQQEVFLWGVKAAARPDTDELIATLVKDPRFDFVDRDALEWVIKIANRTRPEPPIDEREIYHGRRGLPSDSKSTLAHLRNLVRDKYGVAAVPAPPVTATPAKALTRETMSIPVDEDLDLIALSPDGKWLATIEGSRVKIWNADTGKLWWEIPRNSDVPHATGMAFRPDGVRLVVCYTGPAEQFIEWDIARRKSTSKLPFDGRHGAEICRYGITLDGTARRLGVMTYHDLFCVDVESGKTLWLRKGEGTVNGVVGMSPGGALMAVRGNSKDPRAVEILDADNGKSLMKIVRFTGVVKSLAFSPDGRWLATASDEDGAQLWEVSSGKLLRDYAYPVADWYNDDPVFSPDGRWLALVGYTREIGPLPIGIFRVETGEFHWKIPFEVPGSLGPRMPMAFSPDAKVFYVGNTAWKLE